MSWRPEIEEIARRRDRAKSQGGEEAIARQHEQGRLTIRERIARLVDPQSFREHGAIAGSLDEDGKTFTPANYVVGIGKIKGRTAVIGGEDFTLRGGSPNEAGLRKSVYAEFLALKYQIPLIRLLEGGGGSVAGAAKSKRGSSGEAPYAAPRFASLAKALSEIPVVSAALGAVAGFPAARLAASHFSVMVRGNAQLLIAGPAVVERALGQRLSKEELGGADIHLKSGAVDNGADTEEEALAQLSCFLSYLPQNVHELPRRQTCGDPPERADDELLTIIPRDRRKAYDMRKLVRHLSDHNSFFEITAGYGRSLITGLARFDGHAAGILANDCRFYAGAMTGEAAMKHRRFVDLCNNFHLPIVSLVDEPGFMIGLEAEQAGAIRPGTAAVLAAVQSRVPWCSIIIRKAFGVAAAAHFGAYGTVFSWPSAETGALPLEGGVAIAFRREIEAAENPLAKRAELEAQLAENLSPFPRAEGFAVQDLIDPRETRLRICEWLGLSVPLLGCSLGPYTPTLRP
jgi:acetyl-CoA carboxylase carboxyltransferase component